VGADARGLVGGESGFDREQCQPFETWIGVLRSETSSVTDLSRTHTPHAGIPSLHPPTHTHACAHSTLMLTHTACSPTMPATLYEESKGPTHRPNLITPSASYKSKLSSNVKGGLGRECDVQLCDRQFILNGRHVATLPGLLAGSGSAAHHRASFGWCVVAAGLGGWRGAQTRLADPEWR
jgi:hypothetical protein